MGGAFSEGQIIKLEEWFTLPTTPRIEFYRSGFQTRKINRFILSTWKKSIENPFKAPSHLTWPYLISTNVRLLEKILRIINYYEICTIIKRAYAKVRMTKRLIQIDSENIRT